MGVLSLSMHILSADTPTTGYRAFPRAVFLVLPEQFSLNAESATDNSYMQLTAAAPSVALAQILSFAGALQAAGLTVLSFPGIACAPDGVFPNNVIATAENLASREGNARGRYISAKMRHPSRQIEAQRPDFHRFFHDVLGYQAIDLTTVLAPEDTAELTGSLVIDRARNIGFCGLSSRCSEAGARAMHAAFGLNKTYVFPLANGEYHTNVTLSALGGKGVVLCEAGFADPHDAHTIADLYPQRAVWLSAAEKNNFAANCIALSQEQLWLSARAHASLSSRTAQQLHSLGFTLHAVDLSEIEKAGGSLRCTVGEIY
jgi:hypothetical protein